jgi:hypothetical protein
MPRSNSSVLLGRRMEPTRSCKGIFPYIRNPHVPPNRSDGMERLTNDYCQRKEIIRARRCKLGVMAADAAGATAAAGPRGGGNASQAQQRRPVQRARFLRLEPGAAGSKVRRRSVKRARRRKPGVARSMTVATRARPAAGSSVTAM